MSCPHHAGCSDSQLTDVGAVSGVMGLWKNRRSCWVVMVWWWLTATAPAGWEERPREAGGSETHMVFLRRGCWMDGGVEVM